MPDYTTNLNLEKIAQNTLNWHTNEQANINKIDDNKHLAVSHYLIKLKNEDTTGLYWDNSANALKWRYSGADKMVLDFANGILFVGANPDPSTSYKLDVYKGSSGAGAQVIANIGVGSDGSPSAEEGALLSFGVPYTTIPGVQANPCAIGAVKANSTATNYGGHLVFLTREQGNPISEKVRILDNGKVIIGDTTGTALLDINSDILRLRTDKTPASSSASGNAGDICSDANYLYRWHATNACKRIAWTTF
ncbi:MAG: hypothetical protein HY350_02285 [Candidatus Omnitrophica bacterium]|nr:hypothetical protein [Candidatus Omnitrophota bacterium]